ncbi:MAG: glycosyltransferase [Anaeroplasma bactoclasticum]|nr:glycosyltransferase [Anaeroplasma bactoclasticum]
MNILLLSCKTGGGHDACANALKEQFEQMGHTAFVFDYLQLAGEKVAKRVANTYVKTVQRVPQLFGAAYRIGMFVSKHSEHSPVYLANKKMAKYLEAYLDEHHYDAIVMTHLFPAETLTYMKRLGMKLPPHIMVMTDYTCIPFLEETDCDAYIVPHSKLQEECIARGMDKEKLHPLGIPFSPQILSTLTKEEARQKLHLSLDQSVALLVGGSMGAGNLTKLVKTFSKHPKASNIQLVVICGNNQKVYRKLSKICLADTRFILLKHTNEMPLYMKATDIIYTKPGGLTTTEAAASRIPLVHTFPIPGCENANLTFFNTLGMSVSAPQAQGLVDVGLALLESENEKEQMRRAQEENVSRQTTQDTAEFILSMVQKSK